MAAISVQVPYPVFYDRDGVPLDNGNIYIGVANLDPVTNPLQVYYDEALTLTASQPLITSNGYVYRNGTPAQLYVNAANFSILVNDSKNLLVYNFPDGTGLGVGASGIAFTGFKGQVGTVADLADADGSNWIGYTPLGAGAIARSAQEKLRETVSIADFGGIGDGITNNDAAFAAARTYLAAQTICPTLVFPAGVYVYSISPDWGIQWIRMLAQGEVRFRYTGTGNAFIVTDDSFVQMMGLSFFTEEAPLIIEAPATAQNGVLWRSVHHSVGCFVVRGCGATYAGLRIEFAVCSTFPSYRCSFNENASGTQDWYLGAKPKYGLYLDKRNSSESAAYCMFLNPIIEGTEIGIYGVYALGCNFIGGTSEGCTDKGVWLLATSEYNKFIGVDFESNAIADVLCQGRNNSFTDCDSGFPLGEMAFDGVNSIQNIISGGNYQTITFTNNSINNTIRDIVYNRYDATGTGSIVNGVFQAIYNIYNGKTGLRHNQVPYSTAITVGASPFDYTNFTPQPVTLTVSGGTVSSVVVGNGSGSSLNAGIQGQFTIVPNGTATITYTVTPTVRVFSV